jgi:hypothetical protein
MALEGIFTRASLPPPPPPMATPAPASTTKPAGSGVILLSRPWKVPTPNPRSSLPWRQRRSRLSPVLLCRAQPPPPRWACSRGFPSNPAPERLSFSDSSDYGYSSDGSAESPHPVVSGKGKGMEVAPL